MTKRKSMKRNVSLMLLVFCLFCLCTGCTEIAEETYTREELNNLAQIEIYSAENNELIKVIDDAGVLYQYNQSSAFDEADLEERQDELMKAVKDAKEQYYFTAYKSPVARFHDGEPEKVMTTTLYEDTNIIKVVVAEDAVKSLPLPEELLTFYYEVSDEEMEFYLGCLKD